MNRIRTFAVAALVVCFIFPAIMRAEPTPAERVADIQKALQAAKLDGWLFYDFSGRRSARGPAFSRLGDHASGSRRWFYYIPATGEPAKIVHLIERGKLDALPGKRVTYRGWEEQHSLLRETLSSKKSPRVAMQYSPMNDVPYVSRVDAGTIELIRSLGAEIVTSAELVQQFEAIAYAGAETVRTSEASDKLHRVLMEAFAEIEKNTRAEKAITEYDIQQFIARRLAEEGMTREDGIVAVNANAANPHYFPTSEKSVAHQARRFRFAGYREQTPEAGRDLHLIKPGQGSSATRCRKNTSVFSTSCGKLPRRRDRVRSRKNVRAGRHACTAQKWTMSRAA